LSIAERLRKLGAGSDYEPPVETKEAMRLRLRLDEPNRYYLARCVTRLVAEDYADHENFLIVPAPDLKTAEDRALMEHATEGYDEETWLRYGPGQTEDGEWGNCEGFAAFQIASDHCSLDANSLLFVRHIVEITAEEKAVLERLICTYPSKEAEAEQHRLRDVVPPAEEDDDADQSGEPRRRTED
jgi:hypothetical protein